MTMRKNKNEEMKNILKKLTEGNKDVKVMLINISPIKNYNYDVEKALETKFVNLVVVAGMN